MSKQQIDNLSMEDLAHDLHILSLSLKHRPFNDDDFKDTKKFLTSVLSNQWIREKQELTRQLKLARNSCRLKKQDALKRHLILALGYIRNEF